jgi:hypothetical protein
MRQRCQCRLTVRPILHGTIWVNFTRSSIDLHGYGVKKSRGCGRCVRILFWDSIRAAYKRKSYHDGFQAICRLFRQGLQGLSYRPLSECSKGRQTTATIGARCNGSEIARECLMRCSAILGSSSLKLGDGHAPPFVNSKWAAFSMALFPGFSNRKLGPVSSAEMAGEGNPVPLPPWSIRGQAGYGLQSSFRAPTSKTDR